ncbi:retrovirus-related pol polyprotein from transposon TNT 1-94 [Tanacetum coccineum]
MVKICDSCQAGTGNRHGLISRKLFDVLKQFQNEVNDIRSERLARSANPLALLAAAQPNSDNYYEAPVPQRSNAPSYKQSSSYHDQLLYQGHKGNCTKPTNNNLRTSSNSTNKTEDTTPRYNNDNQSRQFGNQRTVTVAGARETVGSPVVQKTGIQCFNCKGFGHYARECRKPKRVKDYAYHKEEDGWMCNKLNKEVSPAESSSTDTPLEQVQNHDENDVFANVRRHSEQPESINDTYVLEKDDSNVIPDSSNICTNDNQVDQNAAECVDERAALANLTSWVHGENKTTNTITSTVIVCIHELKKEMNDDLEYVNSLEMGKLDELESGKIVQLILFIVDSGCTKHMTGNLKLLCNFVEKFLGLNHNLFSIGQFCDADLEVAFRKSTCFVRDLQGNDLLTGNRGSDLYTISLQETTSSTPICFMAKASPTQDGYGIEDFLILTSITSPYSQRKML